MSPTAHNLIPSPHALGATPETTLVRTYVTSTRELGTTNLSISGGEFNNAESKVGGGLAVDVGPLATGDYVLTVRFAASSDAVRVALAPIVTIAGASYMVAPDGATGYRYADDPVGPSAVRAPFASTYEIHTIPLTIPANRPATVMLTNARGDYAGNLDMATAHYAVGLEHWTAAFALGLVYWRLDTAAGEAIRAGYFDGDTPDTADVSYAWTGTPHRSTSVATLGTVIPAPAAAETEDGYMLPAVEGVRWLVNGVPTDAGSYSVQPVTETTTVTIIPDALDGYGFPVAPEPLVLTFEPATPPDPKPNPGDESTWAALMDDDPQALYVATRLAERIIRHVGQDVADLDPAEVLTARDHAMVVLEYVKGYTRDRGFVGYIPHRSLQAVIVAAAARLFTNPEQLTYYSTGDYSERPATMTGWTAAELGVLRRFRKVYA